MEDNKTKLRNLVDSHNGEIEVEGCLLLDEDECRSDIRKVYNDEGNYYVEVDDMEDCKIIDKPLDDFSDEDIELILKYTII